jgi:plastocyanin
MCAGSALGAAPAAASDQNVQILNANTGAFQPSSVQVDPGQSVTWTNKDAYSHNAKCGGPPDCPVNFSSGDLMAQNKSETYTFRYSGTYHYVCAAHANMTGTVVVTGNVQPPNSASGASSTPPSTTGSSANGGTTAGSGGGATPPGGGAGTTSSSGGNQAVAGAPAGGSTTAPGGETDVKQALAGINLPGPNVTVHTPANQGTPFWAVLATGAALLVCAAIFGFAWFGPPIRLGGRGR